MNLERKIKLEFKEMVNHPKVIDLTNHILSSKDFEEDIELNDSDYKLMLDIAEFQYETLKCVIRALEVTKGTIYQEKMKEALDIRNLIGKLKEKINPIGG